MHPALPWISDPNLAACLYAHAALDETLLEIVAPWRLELRNRGGDPRPWVIRSGRRGQHLKLRATIQGDEGAVAHAFERLRRRAEQRWRRLPALAVERPEREEIPALDAEDERSGVAADRTVARTRYRRSPVTLGAHPFPGEDPVVWALHAGLGAGFTALTDTVQEPKQLARRRPTLGLGLLLDGLGALEWDLASAAAYCRYHRDWLLRFFVPEAARELDLRRHFDQRIEAMGAQVEAVAERAAVAFLEPRVPPRSPWPTAVVGLAHALEPYRDRPEYRIDPHADDARDPVLFKLFHGVANQLGLHPLDEAMLHHLLDAGLAAGTARRGAA